MNQILDMLAYQWFYDISVMSQGWVIFTVFPAMVYFVFMIFKWAFLTLPIWLPVAIIQACKGN